MQTHLNASKAWKTIPAGPLKKREPSQKHKKSILCLVTVVSTETEKVKQLHSDIPNLKHKLSPESTIKN